jgi:hypothetical protein
MLAFVGGTRARRYGEKAHLSSCALLALSSRDVMELNPKRRVDRPAPAAARRAAPPPIRTVYLCR